MMTWNFRLAIAAGALAVAGSANAATATSTFQVTATVNSACQATATNLAFGAYTPGSGLINQTSTVSVRCTQGTTYSIGLNAGTFGTIAARQMGFGAQRLNYSLFRDAARTQNWGNTPPTDTVAGSGTGIAAAYTAYTVYGQILDSAANQAVTPGAYTDTITVTVTY
jgi:spore coat protein U-like protein